MADAVEIQMASPARRRKRKIKFICRFRNESPKLLRYILFGLRIKNFNLLK